MSPSKARAWTRTAHGVPAGTRLPRRWPLYQAPRRWAERANPHNLIHYRQLDRGGHFAAWEQSELFAAEVCTAFRSLR